MQGRIEQSGKQSSSPGLGRRLRAARYGAAGGVDDAAATNSTDRK